MIPEPRWQRGIESGLMIQPLDTIRFSSARSGRVATVDRRLSLRRGVIRGSPPPVALAPPPFQADSYASRAAASADLCGCAFY